MNLSPSIFRRLGPVPFHCLLIGLCSWALYAQSVFRIPGWFFLFLLPIVSISVGVLSVIILVTYLMGRVPIEEPFRSIFHALERWSRIFVLGFCYYGVFLVGNAHWGPPISPSNVSSEILEIARVEIDLGYPIRYAYAKLRSWNDPNTSEWLFLHYAEQEQLWRNQQVLVQLQRGYFNVPWVLAVEPDQEKQLLSVLRLSPTASQGWRDLITFYLSHRRWSQARQATTDYLNIYPNQIAVANHSALLLLTAGRFDDVIALLQPLIVKKKDYRMHTTLGFALMMTGKTADGVKLIEGAIAMEPNNFWAYYKIGYAHTFTGTSQAAVPYFKKLLELRPNFPEIEYELQKIEGNEAKGKT